MSVNTTGSPFQVCPTLGSEHISRRYEKYMKLVFAVLLYFVFEKFQFETFTFK